ncbi:NAD-dependent epimerase/dehydratase family protein [Devosia sp. SD17-2]|uniref:NAD-dependent epimerase/dehydratase family protein n=1 Tax=Devosia sp. SD17-2 TaxID=2976459 RepID=UPI0023D82027|nr:NAD-dependent epimerase/dehydratase family protein [Devosia sp. SD17-2]WEJ32932.1 GDP-mannose 4,6-dehydratase [Devosia sp. SD17-2]
MNSLRLMITGANGFVGRKVTEAARRNPAFELVKFIDETGASPDIADADAVDRAIAAARPDRVLHLAAIAAPRQAQADASRAWAVNFSGTLQLAQALMKHRPEARLVWSGSSEAYGASFNRGPLPLAETAALEPANVYGATKAAADIALGQLGRSGALDTAILRPFNHTGPGQAADYVVPAFAAQIAAIEKGEQEPVLKVGNLDALRDFLDVEDVVALYIAALLAEGRIGGEAYNVATGKPVRIGDLLEGLLSEARVKIGVETDPARYAPNAVPVASGNPEKARERFSWAPQIAINDTLKGVLDALRAS